jgi:hypothetical protein
MAEALLKLRGYVHNGKRVYDHPDIQKMVLDELEGKRFEELIKKEHVSKSSKQLGYYFGGIIAATCMKAEKFGGWTRDEIDDFLREILRPYKVVRSVNGKMTVEDKTDSLADYSVEEMSLFLEDVLNFLATEDIHPLSSEDYNLKKYYHEL